MKFNIKSMSGVVASAAIAAIVLTGCGTGNTTSTFDASSVTCDKVQPMLTATNNAVHQDDVTEAKEAGTPPAKAAQDKRNQDANKATLLSARQVQCNDAQTTTTTPPVPVQSPQPTLTAQQLTDQLTGHFDNYTIGADTSKDTLLLGSQVTTTGHTEVRGANAFSQKTLTSPAEVGAFLQSDMASRTRVVNALTAAGYGQDEINRALNGNGYFAVQEKVASNIYGTSFKVGDTAVVEVGARSVPANDIQWLYATSDGKIIYGAAVRADCGNPNLEKVVPIPPGTPPALSIGCINTSAPGCQPTHVCTTCTTTSAPPHVCSNCNTSSTTTPPMTTCSPCVSPATASQPVNDHQSPVPQDQHPPQPSGATAPAQRPTPPPSAAPGTVPPPDNTGNGYSNGGTGSAPGGAQCSNASSCSAPGTNPKPSGPPATPYPSTTNVGDPGPP